MFWWLFLFCAAVRIGHLHLPLHHLTRQRKTPPDVSITRIRAPPMWPAQRVLPGLSRTHGAAFPMFWSLVLRRAVHLRASRTHIRRCAMAPRAPPGSGRGGRTTFASARMMLFLRGVWWILHWETVTGMQSLFYFGLLLEVLSNTLLEVRFFKCIYLIFWAFATLFVPIHSLSAALFLNRFLLLAIW